MKTSSAMAIAIALAAASFAASASDPPVVRDGRITSAAGHALYTFDHDTAMESFCGRPCIMIWPPLTGDALDEPLGAFTLVERRDGTRQWAYAGRLLYRYIGDRTPRDFLGDSIGSVWHVARP